MFKSTLLSVISDARPKIAAYHFTTLQPNLGMVLLKDGRSFVAADLPGLIEGASQGLGLGFEFLRHVERTKVILHILDGSKIEGGLFEDYETIRHELESYDPEILKKGEIIVINKADDEHEAPGALPSGTLQPDPGLSADDPPDVHHHGSLLYAAKSDQLRRRHEKRDV